MTRAEAVNHPIDRDTQLCISLAARPSNVGTRFHNFLFRALELNYVYKAFAPVNIAQAVQAIRGLPIRGAAVSMPFKSEVIPMLDELDSTASAISAVNTIVNTAGNLCGFNTDFAAVRELLRGRVGDSAVVHGAGGIAKAVVAALHELQIPNVTVCARSLASATALADAYGYNAATQPIPASVLINCTPIGMTGAAAESELAFAVNLINGADLVFDVVAMPSMTPLIKTAIAANVETIQGSELMTAQAVAQFVLYTGIEPPPDLVAAAASWARAGSF